LVSSTNINQNIKEGIEGKPVDWYSDVFDVVFPNIDYNRANSLWKKELKKKKRPSKQEKEEKEKDEEDSDEGYDTD
jgi:Lon-like ATP-dependent protease